MPNKTFFFTNYEARRFPRTTQVSRTVPTDSLKAGLLQFRDAAGNIVSYNLRALDPRGIGLNPVVSSLWGLLPGGNDPSRGDGFNTTGFTAEADTSFEQDAVVLRLDHNFSTTGAWTATTGSAASARPAPRRPTSAGCCPATPRACRWALEDLPREPRLLPPWG